jgi:hypothetical protein
MAVRYEPYAGEKITLLEMYRDFYAPVRSEEHLRRYLRVPAHYKDKAYKEQLLRELLEGKVDGG